MSDQTPAEMRKEAIRLRDVADVNAEHGWENNAASCRAGADALDRLADPVRLGKLAWEAAHDHGAFARDFPDEEYFRAVGEAIARGEVRGVQS